MNRSILIADQGSLCGKEIIDIYLMNNYKVMQTVVNKGPGSNTDIIKNKKAGEKLLQLDWNCFSAISQKNLVLKAKNSITFNCAGIIFTPPEVSELFIGQSQIEIHESIDFYFRSLVIITKEIISTLNKKPDSSLYLILNSKNKDKMYTEIYKAFINSVLTESRDYLSISAIDNNFDSPQQFAECFFNLSRQERKTSGKWIKMLQINSLFNSLSRKR